MILLLKFLNNLYQPIKIQMNEYVLYVDDYAMEDVLSLIVIFYFHLNQCLVHFL